MKNEKDSYSEKLNFESFFLLIKPGNNILSNQEKRNSIYEEIEKLIELGLKNLEISWTDDKKWLDFVSEIRIRYPNINLGSASIVNQKSIDDSLKIGLNYSMMKFWDKDLFNYAKTKNYLLIPGIQHLNDLNEAINLNCKIVKIYPIKNIDKLINIRSYENVKFIAAGGLSIADIEHLISLGYISIVIGETGFKNEKFDPKLYELLKEKFNKK